MNGKPLLPWGVKITHYESEESPCGHCTQGEARFVRLQVTTFLGDATSPEIRDAQQYDSLKVVLRLREDLVRSLAETDRYLQDMQTFMSKSKKKKGGRKGC